MAISGCSGRESRAQHLYAEAQQHVDRAEFAEAVEALDEILDRYPGTKAAERARQDVALYRGLSTAVETYATRRVRDQMVGTARAIYRYEDRRHRWPDALQRLVPNYLDQPPIDPWGRELIYIVKPRRRGYVLGCLGADGSQGGDGESRDWFIENGRFVSRPSVELP